MLLGQSAPTMSMILGKTSKISKNTQKKNLYGRDQHNLGKKARIGKGFDRNTLQKNKVVEYLWGARRYKQEMSMEKKYRGAIL